MTASRLPGPRIGLIVAIVGLAFLAGLALMGYAVRNTSWFANFRPGQQVQSAAGDASGFSPAAPLSATEAAAPPEPDMDLLMTREAALAGQLTSLEARTASVSTDAAAAGNQAARAEALLIAVAARRALDHGAPLGYLEEQLRARFGIGQPRATNYVIQAARQPVTLESLRQQLDAISPAISAPDDGGWWQGMRNELSTLVVLHRSGTPSPFPADRLARARRQLDAGQVEAARAEVAAMPGAADAKAWEAAAGRYLTARRAIDQIENAALLGQGSMIAPQPALPQ